MIHNAFLTRDDVEKAALQVLTPAFKKLSPGCAQLHLGETGAVYPAFVADMEGFSRQFWALVPLIMGKSEKAAPLFSAYLTGLKNGTDPSHEEYWGTFQGIDQRMVEMAALALGMIFLPDAFYRDFDSQTQKNIYNWLNQINLYDMPTNNWRFFRVLVNVGFRLNNLPTCEDKLNEDFALIEEHYESDGWYYDYFNQRDYYTPWAYHYYGLVYSVAMKELDPVRCALYQSRAALFAPRFAMWFAADGEALPYGRSLTYRFAQSSFFAALAFAGVTTEAFGYGEMKHILLSNLRKWFSRPIFTQEGILTIGYGYPNLMMGEGYNAPGSPYWANKAFLALAMPDNHPFWTCEEKPFTLPETLREDHMRMLITRDKRGRHVQGFAAGNHSTQHSHDEAKYEKFVYSTLFAFSVPKCMAHLRSGAFDSVMAVSLDGVFYHPRYGNESYEIRDDCVRFTWHPFPFVTIRTEIRPMGDWHTRTHIIETTHPLYVAEGGFAIRREEGDISATVLADATRAMAQAAYGTSYIEAVQGFDKGEVIIPEPNTNLLYSRTYIPTLLGTLPVGETTLISRVLGSPENINAIWEA